MIHSAPVKSPGAPNPVLLFDGECGLCNRVVRLLLRLDRGARLRFAPLQGPPAQGFLRAHNLPVSGFDSFVLVPDWSRPGSPEFLLRTDALIEVLRACGGAGRLLGGALRLLPARSRDAAYRVVARWRYRVFGVWRPRPLARPEWAARFVSPASGDSA
jgi:predicted DCC family thiol-disulfide oxidoreductase YuxK